MIKRGSTVQQIVHPIVGTVIGYQIDQETGNRLIHVSWSDEEGEHSRFFTEDEIEVTAEPE